MTNNDVLRRIRYTFNYSDSKMIEIFNQADYKATLDQVKSWLKKEDNPSFLKCKDIHLAIFLDGLINDRRGKKEREQPVPVKHLNNNIIFRKLKIALDLKAEDILEILALSDVIISKHELSAFFRKSNHKHFRSCQDQILRNFINGMQLKYRDSALCHA